ncbi:MAG: cupin domain-containing protein [archaeon]|nr:cupin domain-containing protein [archaeon]
MNFNHPKNQTGLKSAEAIDIAELLSYQDGAIVSKTLNNTNCGTITLFAFDQGQGLSEHTSPFNAFVQILDGNAEITVSGRRFRANEGQIVILPANQPHALNALSKFKMLLIMIRSE